MKTSVTFAALAAIAGLTAACASPAEQALVDPNCPSGFGVDFICGVLNPEDLVHVPDTRWIIGSSLIRGEPAQGGGLLLIDSVRRTATKLPAPAGTARAPYDACTAPPAADAFSTHGLFIRPDGPGRAMLYVVGHRGREMIEVFDVVARGEAPPAVTWAGCLGNPPGAFVNSVAVTEDGARAYATEYYRPPLGQGDLLAGRDTGSVWVWSRADRQWDEIPGTMLPGANGVAVTPNESHLFVAVTGTSQVMRYQLGGETSPERIQPGLRTDNLRWAPDGRLLLAGPGIDPDCTPGPATSCVTVPYVAALDPQSLEIEVLKAGPGEPEFPGIASALIVGDELWMGSYNAQRIAVQELE